MTAARCTQRGRCQTGFLSRKIQLPRSSTGYTYADSALNLFRAFFPSRRSQRAQKMDILSAEVLSCCLLLFAAPRSHAGGSAPLHLIQPDRRLQHQQDLEALPANVLDDLGDLLGLGHRFVDGFAQLLDKIAQSWIQRRLPDALVSRVARARFPYLVRCANESNGESAADKLFPMEPEKLGRSLGIGVRVAGKCCAIVSTGSVSRSLLLPNLRRLNRNPLHRRQPRPHPEAPGKKPRILWSGIRCAQGGESWALRREAQSASGSSLGTLGPRRQYSLAGDFRGLLCSLRRVLRAKRLSGARRMEGRSRSVLICCSMWRAPRCSFGFRSVLFCAPAAKAGRSVPRARAFLL